MKKSFRERFILTRLHKDERRFELALTIFGILLFVLILNILYLNFISYQSKNIYLSQEVGKTVSPSPLVDNELTTPTATIAPTFPHQNSYNAGQSAEQTIKEYFISFGSGTNSSSDWEDVPGAIAAVDLGGYKNIKEIKFEVSVTVPTANQAVWVRLYNKTDQHPVWNSEVIMNGGASAYLVSQPLVYDRGVRTYQVQMKTQLKHVANLTQSRLHINLN